MSADPRNSPKSQQRLCSSVIGVKRSVTFSSDLELRKEILAWAEGYHSPIPCEDSIRFGGCEGALGINRERLSDSPKACLTSER